MTCKCYFSFWMSFYNPNFLMWSLISKFLLRQLRWRWHQYGRCSQTQQQNGLLGGGRWSGTMSRLWVSRDVGWLFDPAKDGWDWLGSSQRTTQAFKIELKWWTFGFVEWNGEAPLQKWVGPKKTIGGENWNLGIFLLEQRRGPWVSIYKDNSLW